MRLTRRAFHQIEQAAETLDGVRIDLTAVKLPSEAAPAVRRLLAALAALELAVELIEAEN